MNIYYYNINEFHNLDACELLTPARQTKLQRYRSYEDQARCLAAGLLMRRFLNVTDDSQIIYGSNQKPYLKNQSAFFNISHSGDYVVLAAAECEVGIDIEKILPNREKIAKRFFTTEENQWLTTKNNEKAFFDLWTAKEAVMKCTGQGMKLSPASFCVLPVQDGSHTVQGKPLHLYWQSLDGHSLCIASEQPQNQPLLIPVSLKTLLNEHEKRELE